MVLASSGFIAEGLYQYNAIECFWEMLEMSKNNLCNDQSWMVNGLGSESYWKGVFTHSAI